MGKATILAGGLALLALPAFAADPIGDPGRGAQVFRQCQSCHDIGPGAEIKVGPPLNEIFGRRLGRHPGYLDQEMYSEDMVRMGNDGITWNLVTLDIYILNPKILVSGTYMEFSGIRNAADRADLVAFLRQYSASPRDIPESPPTAVPSDPPAPAGLLAIRGDPEYGEYLASECVTCHRADGAAEGIPSITGWAADDFSTAMHAYRAEYRPHPVMRMIASRLGDEEIAALAAYFESL